MPPLQIREMPPLQIRDACMSIWHPPRTLVSSARLNQESRVAQQRNALVGKIQVRVAAAAPLIPHAFFREMTLVVLKGFFCALAPRGRQDIDLAARLGVDARERVIML